MKRPPEVHEGRPHEGDAQPAATGSEAHPQRTTLKRRPAVFASVYEPTDTRQRWLLCYRCPWCNDRGHHGFAQSLDDIAPDHGEGRRSGVRRAPCGKRVWIVVARIFRAHEQQQQGTDAAHLEAS